jgi:hypothetical protein
LDKSIAVFCRECRKKLCDVADINEARQSRCPVCDSIYRSYRMHMISQPSEDADGMRTNTATLIQNKYDSVNISIFDELKLF